MTARFRDDALGRSFVQENGSMIRRTSVVFALFILVAGLMAAGLRADDGKSPKSKPKPAAPQKTEQGTPEAKPAKDDDYELQKLLVDTIDQVERNYVKSVTRRELVEAAIKGVL